jgi:hypothetical protein
MNRGASSPSGSTSTSERGVLVPVKSDYVSSSPTDGIPPLRYDYMSSDYSPALYSKEDIRRIHQRKDQLEGDIVTLRKKYSTLKRESKKIKDNLVKGGDLSVLQAETRDEMSQNHSAQLNDSIELLTNEIKNVKAAKVLCGMLEKQIKEAERQKNYIMQENAAVDSLFNFDQFQMRLPTVQKLKLLQSYDNSAVLDDNARLRKFQQQIIGIDCRKILTSGEQEASISVVKTTESQYKASSSNARLLKVDISHLQRVIADQEWRLKRMTADLMRRRRTMTSLSISEQQDNAEAAERTLIAENGFSEEKEILDRQISSLRLKIDERAAVFDDIVAEIGELEEEGRNAVIAEESIFRNFEENLVEEEEESEVIIDGCEVIEMEEKLRNVRDELKEEIMKVNKDISELKMKAKSVEVRKKDEIKNLYKKYRRIRRKVGVGVVELKSGECGGVSLEFGKLLEHIDGSIAEIRKGIE